MRGWSDGEEEIIGSVFARGPGASSADGAGAPGEHASQWAAIGSIAAKIGCTGGDAAELGTAGGARPGLRAGPTSEERERIKALERENRELRQANEILRKASAYFAMAELDRRSKP